MHRVAILGVIGLIAFGLAVHASYCLWRRKPLPWPSRVGLGLTLTGVVCFFYALFIEADWLQVTHLTVQTAKWKKGKTLRIAHFSDLHVDRESRALDRLGQELAKAKPDLIVFTGDSINEAGALKLFRTTIGGFPSRLGRLAVRGNHDTYRWGALDLFSGVAVELTHGPVVFDDGAISVCGAAFNKFDALPDCIAGAPKGAFTVVAFHTPDLVEDLDPKPDLYLAGHTHGGQVALPFYGALVTFSRFDKKYESGTFQVGPTTLNVNRGIGFEPHLPRVRFFSRPELTLIDVEGTAD
ncbi:MAG: metallophosphoesterase [Myxococcaceae bacterium]